MISEEEWTDILTQLNNVDLQNIPADYVLQLKKAIEQSMALMELTQASIKRSADMIKKAIVIDSIAKSQK